MMADLMKGKTAICSAGMCSFSVTMMAQKLPPIRLAMLITSMLPAVKEATLVPQPVAPPLAEGEEPEEKESEPVAAGEVIKVVAEHSQQAIVNVLGFLNDRDINLTSLQILEPNLESVFLHLTGKKLRE